MFYNNSFSIVTTKTWYRKSLIAMAIATMHRWVTVVEVLLLGMGADQVAKIIHADKNIEGYHVNECCGPKRTLCIVHLIHKVK